jgi:hypothetical protein
MRIESYGSSAIFTKKNLRGRCIKMRKLLIFVLVVFMLSQVVAADEFPENFPPPPEIPYPDFPEFTPYTPPSLPEIQPLLPPIPTTGVYLPSEPENITLEGRVSILEQKVEQLFDLADRCGNLLQQAAEIFRMFEDQISELYNENQILKILLLFLFTINFVLIGIIFWKLGGMKK